LDVCTLLHIAAAIVVGMVASVVVSDLPEHCAKRMRYSVDSPADVAAAAEPTCSPMAVELPFPGEFVDREFQVVYETL
jgi:hypothetical protein